MNTITKGHPLSADEIPETIRHAYDFASQHLEYIASRKRRMMTIERTCLNCKATKRIRVSIVRECLRRSNTLSGLCKSCSHQVGHPQPKGENSPRWKGGKRQTPYGYIMMRCPDHPRAQNDYVFEHRLVMEKKLGRYLLPQETVHHKNGVKYDNRPENLELWTKKHGNGIRYEELDDSAIQELIEHLQALLNGK